MAYQGQKLFEYFLWAKLKFNEECMTVNYRKLIQEESLSAKIKKIILENAPI